MTIFNLLSALVPQYSQIRHTKIKNIFTKHGLFQAKVYINNNQEYLSIMSLNCFEVEEPIIYIHSDTHQCDPLDQECGCHHQIDLALPTLSKEGGLLIYTSEQKEDIDILLNKLNTRASKTDSKITLSTNYRSALKGYRGANLTFDFILKELKLSKVQLVTNNPNVTDIVEQLGINVSRRTPMISYRYGDSVQSSGSDVLEQAMAIDFNYRHL